MAVKTYKDTPQNRKLGRVGMTYNSPGPTQATRAKAWTVRMHHAAARNPNMAEHYNSLATHYSGHGYIPFNGPTTPYHTGGIIHPSGYSGGIVHPAGFSGHGMHKKKTKKKKGKGVTGAFTQGFGIQIDDKENE